MNRNMQTKVDALTGMTYAQLDALVFFVRRSRGLPASPPPGGPGRSVRRRASKLDAELEPQLRAA